jgi:8-oxo-dGTP pyrophosphatase MutT (NUDIX family)
MRSGPSCTLRIMLARGGSQRIPRPPDARPGGPPPWGALPPDARHFTVDEIRDACRALPQPQRLTAVAPSRPCAVLVPMFDADGEARVILTKRPETMPSHQGEIAFPGGKHQPDVDESLLHAALREAQEEIGLEPSLVEVAAELDSLGTVASRFTITPFVGLLDGRPALHRNTYEVVSVFDVAIADLLDPDAYREERWDLRVPGASVEPARVIQFFLLPGETVWGATARILAGFLAHLTAPRLDPETPVTGRGPGG